MGFDIYGLNPHNPKKLVKPTIDWSKQHTEEEKDIYFKSIDYYESQVPGHYFRNNVWWWRPLWDYIYTYTNCLSEKDWKSGHHNSAYQIDGETSIRIATKLHELIDSKHAKEHEEMLDVKAKAAKKHNKEIEDKCEIIKQIVIEKNQQKYIKLGYSGQELEDKREDFIAPMDYPKKEKEMWDKLQAEKDWSDSYPFSVENVREFANFCYQSGGFEIC